MRDCRKPLLKTFLLNQLTTRCSSARKRGDISMATPKGQKPGSIAEVSGQAKKKGAKTEITLIKGKRIPPQGRGKKQRIRVVDPTKHKG